MGGYVELHCHSAYSFLDGASHPEELVARAAELGYPSLALTDHDGVYGSLEFAHAAKHAGIRPITGAEVTIERREPHITLLCESGQGYANLCRILTAAHAGTRRPGREDREPLPPAVALETVAELNEGLVCLSGCARDGLALHDPGGAARLAARVRPRAVLRRAAAAVRAGRREAPRDAPRSRRAPRRRDDRHRQRPRPRAAAHAAPGRARRDPLPHLARRLRAGAAREPRGGAAIARRDGRALRRHRPSGGGAHRPSRRAPDLRPHRGARLPLPRLLRPRRSCDPPARRDLRPRVRRAVQRK